MSVNKLHVFNIKFLMKSTVFEITVFHEVIVLRPYSYFVDVCQCHLTDADFYVALHCSILTCTYNNP